MIHILYCSVTVLTRQFDKISVSSLGRLVTGKSCLIFLIEHLREVVWRSGGITGKEWPLPIG
jgi:hypothetical protein